MFVKILLSALCVHIVTSNTNTTVHNTTVEYDDFIPFGATPVKDEFDWKLLQKFTSAKGYKNVIISPISLKLVLALLYEGSAGLTQKEFQDILKFPADKSQLRHEFTDLLDTLIVDKKNYIINIGSQLFLDSHLTALASYRAKALDFYHTEVTRTNFSNPEQANTQINSWVKNITHGRIKSLVTPDDIENAVLLVANAIYFKGMWSLPFPINETFTGSFYTSSKNSVSVSYMKQTEQFFYFDSKSLDAELLRIPYKGRKFALYIILPHSRDGLSYLIDNLDFREVILSAYSMNLKAVRVILPKFRFDFQTRFSSILHEFGFDTLFRGISSFPDIVRDQQVQLVVTDILQKSGIDVNEEGTIVYTTSQVTLGNKFGGENIITFNVSRPFLFFIQEVTTNNLLFIGKVENPLDVESIPLESKYGTGEDSGKVPHTELSQSVEPNYPIDSSGLVRPAFDLELLKNCLGTSKNVLLSPSSVKVSLAMLAEAATGGTAEEIYSILQVPQYRKNEVFQGLVSELSESQPHSVLQFQNAMFVSKQQTIKAQYQAVAERYYKALLKQIDYHDAGRAASEINGFVNKATEGFIPTIISADEINYETEVILANVLYFKADWLKVFDKEYTKPGYFYSPRGRINVSFMHTIDNFTYAETLNAEIVNLDYAGKRRAMLLVVPKQKDGLLSALKDLEAYQGFGELIASLHPSEVELFLPKFEIEYNKNIVNTLQKMGIRQVFDANSKLSNLLEGDKSSLVDSFIHKTKIEVTEEGTEASAISLTPVVPLMGSSNPQVRANHPFAFFIYNTYSNTILFEGVLNEPEQKLAPEVKTGNIYTPAQAVQNRGANSLPFQQEREQHQYNPLNLSRF